MITLIVAINKKGIIASNQTIPWHVAEDLAFFKDQTLFKSVLMGRKTFETLKKPLPNRFNIVLSKQNPTHIIDGVVYIKDVGEVINQFQHSTEELMVAGGAQVYHLMMPYADKIIVSLIDDMADGDTCFPFIHPTDFKVESISQHKGFDVIVYLRKGRENL